MRAGAASAGTKTTAWITVTAIGRRGCASRRTGGCGTVWAGYATVLPHIDRNLRGLLRSNGKQRPRGGIHEQGGSAPQSRTPTGVIVVSLSVTSRSRPIIMD